MKYGKNWFAITKVCPQVWAIAEFHHWEKVVSYLLVAKKEAFLFDTGMGYRNIKEIVESITKLPVTVLLTHAHWDHIGGVNEFTRIGILDNLFEKAALQKGFRSKKVDELSKSKFFDNPFKPIPYIVAGRRPSFVFRDKDTIYIDKYHINVMATPGHTPGSTCFFIAELGILITGDTLYPGPIYLHLPESNVDDYKESMKKLMKIHARIKMILPGHNAIRASVRLLTDSKIRLLLPKH